MTARERGKQAMQALAYDENALFDELDDPEFARGFVAELCNLQDQQVPLFRNVIVGSREQAADFQVSPLDSLLEIIQNADDAGARGLVFDLRRGELLARHDGRPLVGRDVVGIALPNFSTKQDDAEAIGRFGIGLKTVFSLASSISVRDGRYALRTSPQGVQPWKPRDDGSTTELRLELKKPLLASDLADWFERLGGDGLIFTRNLEEVIVQRGSEPLREIRLKRTSRCRREMVGIDWPVTSERVGFWTVYRASVPVPADFKRNRKAVADTVTISMAVGPPQGRGRLCLGLPTGHQWDAPLSYDAPFDPDATRRTIKESEPNEWLLERLGELNAAVVAHRGKTRPETMWAAVPLRKEFKASRPWLEARLHSVVALVTDATHELSVPGIDGNLADAWWPDDTTEGVLEDSDLVLLSGGAIVPREVRDKSGRWRSVMRANSLGRRVGPTGLQDLTHYTDEELGKPAQWFVRVAGTLLDLSEALLEDAVVLVDREGERHTTESARSGVVLVTGSLQHRFPVLRQIHPAFLDDDDSTSRVRSWLQNQHILVDQPTDLRLLEALAGRDEGTPIAVDDDDLHWLRLALHDLGDAERGPLARQVGARITLDGFRYLEDGSRMPVAVRPSQAYLPSGLDRTAQGFGRAAGRTPGLHWIDRRYDEVLRAPKPEGDIRLPAAVSFLQELGAALIPRLVDAQKVHDGRRGRSSARRGRLQAEKLEEGDVAATKSVNAASPQRVVLNSDKDSPDLMAVAKNIAVAEEDDDARERGLALLTVLRRAWTNREQPWREAASVRGAFFYHRQRGLPGRFPARWRSRVADVAWLTDAGGDRRPPRRSSLRTRQLRLIEGDAEHHIVIDDPDGAWVELAQAIGMRADPETSQVIDRLKELRDSQQGSRIAATASACYRLLASRIPEKPQPTSQIGDLSLAQLRGFFGVDPAKPGLVHCDDRWLTPHQVVIGSHGFGHLRGAVPDREDTRPLWDALGLQEENATAAHKVLEELAAEVPSGTRWRSAMVQALRFLAHTEPTDRGRLDELPLWCGNRWVRERPVYVCGHPVVAERLEDSVPVWTPECDPASLGSLLDDLDVTTIGMDNASQVRVQHAAEPDDSLTQRFAAATLHFRDLLEQHEPELLESLNVAWEEFQGLIVGVSTLVAARVSVDDVEVRVELPIAYDSEFGVVVGDGEWSSFQDPDDAEGLLVFFYENASGEIPPLYRAGLYWAQAWRQASSHEVAVPLELERVTPSEPGADGENAEPLLAEAVTGVRADSSETEQDEEGSTAASDKSRLKRPEAISLTRVRDTEMGGDAPERPKLSSGRTTRRNLPLDEAEEDSAQGKRVRGRSQPLEDSEELGWRIVEAILADAEDPQVRDLRRRRDVGADGYDPRRDKALELKAYRGPIPDSIQLQKSQIREARKPDRGYWLFVIGGLAESHELEVMLIDDPLAQLEIADQPSVKMKGVRSAQALARWTESIGAL